ncbi:Spastin, partial [Aduncisulcus paluster]
PRIAAPGIVSSEDFKSCPIGTYDATRFNQLIDQLQLARHQAQLSSSSSSAVPKVFGSSSKKIAHKKALVPTQSKPSTAVSASAKKEEAELRAKIKSDPEAKKLPADIIETIMNEVRDPKKTTFDDISGLKEVKQILEQTCILPSIRPDLYTGMRAPPKGILLYGPPGNGKTMLARAAANEAGCTFLSMSASTLMSKWVGESEKLMRAMFVVARALQPTIVFLDEVDSLIRVRGASDNESSRRLKTQFLIEMDGATSDAGKRVLILAATNRPQELDDAAIRRFTKRVCIPMPSLETKIGLISTMLKSMKKDKIAVKVSKKEIKAIASKCNGFSCSDISTLVKSACNEPLMSLSAKELRSVKKEDLRPVVSDDFMTIIKVTKPSIPPENLKAFDDWTRDYGS